MTLFDVSARFHGWIGLELGSGDLRATLTIGQQAVRIGLETGEVFTYDGADVLWSPLDESTVRLETPSERAFFTADAPLDFTQFSNPAAGPNRRIHALPSIETAWTDLPDTVPDLDHHRSSIVSQGKRANCTHRWRELRPAGGIDRRACADCGNVTIDLRAAQIEAASHAM